MRILVTVDIADLLDRSRHAPHAPEIVEEHEAGIEINALEDIVRDQHTQEIPARTLLLEFVVEIADKGIAGQQMLIILPLENDGTPFIRTGNGIEHVTIALRMDAFLE